MRLTVPAVLVALLLVVAGCTGTPANNGATQTGTENTTSIQTTTDYGTQSSAETVSVEYAVSTGDFPDEIESVELTLQVVFVENPQDFAHGSCWRETFRGPYKPTITPIPTHPGDCHRSRTVTVVLTDPGGSQSLGEFTAPERFSAGHGLIVTDVAATYQNGTAVRGIRGKGGHRANIVSGVPNGSYRVKFGIKSWDEPAYLYSILSEPSKAPTHTETATRTTTEPPTKTPTITPYQECPEPLKKETLTPTPSEADEITLPPYPDYPQEITNESVVEYVTDVERALLYREELEGEDPIQEMSVWVSTHDVLAKTDEAVMVKISVQNHGTFSDDGEQVAWSGRYSVTYLVTDTATWRSDINQEIDSMGALQGNGTPITCDTGS